jgi:hypothetical protein
VSYLINVSRLNGKPNLGGIVEILVARKVDVVALPSPVNGVVYGDIELQEGSSFVRWFATQESSGIKSSARISREGSSKTNRLPFRLPLDLESVRAMMDKAMDDEFIVLFKYPNGKQKIFGSIEAPVRFEYDHSSGEGFADGSFNNCQFYYDGPENIFFYDGSVPTPSPGAAPAWVKYNDEVIAVLYPGESLNIESDFGFTDFYITT